MFEKKLPEITAGQPFFLLFNKQNRLALTYMKTWLRKQLYCILLYIFYSAPLGAYSFQTHLRGSLIETGGLFNLEKTKVSVRHKKLEYKVEKLNYDKLEVMQPRIKNKSELPVGE